MGTRQLIYVSSKVIYVVVEKYVVIFFFCLFIHIYIIHIQNTQTPKHTIADRTNTWFDLGIEAETSSTVVANLPLRHRDSLYN